MSYNINQVITYALNTSPYTRATHDNIYPKNFFKYAVRKTVVSDGHSNPAFLKYSYSNKGTIDDIRLGFDPDEPLEENVAHIHHEEVHVGQLYNFKKAGLGTELFGRSLDSRIANNVVWEAQAFTLGYEGPLMKLLSDIENADQSNFSLYGGMFSYLKTQMQFLENTYMAELCPGSACSITQGDRLNPDALRALNGFNRLPQGEKDARIAKARKASVSLMADNKPGKPSSILDIYALQAMSDHRDFANSHMTMPPVYQIFKFLQPVENKGISLTQILETTRMSDGRDFLSTKDWCEALKGRSNQAVAKNFMSQSRYLGEYQKLKI